ncbi:MAG TPA: hypothetical protein VH475_13140 [Tepidisphaeraceae bacterium]|jgi:hypothetical protein
MSVGPQDGVVQFIQASDPAAQPPMVTPMSYPSSVAPKRPVLAGMWWLDTSSTPFRLRRRNDANTAWDPIGASTMAPYITQRPSAELTNEQALSALPTGILKNTATTGVLSIASGSDLPAHQHPSTEVSDFSEAAQDAVGGMAQATASVRLSYDDAAAVFRADAIFGTAAGTVAEGNHLHPPPVHALRRVTADTTVVAGDEVIVVDAGGPATVRLPPAPGWMGRILTVCRHSANGAVTVLADGADRIWGPGANGVASQGLSSRGAFLILLGETATTWRMIGTGGNVQLLEAPTAETLPAN